MTLKTKAVLPAMQKIASLIGIATNPAIFVQLGESGPRIAVNELRRSGRDILIVTAEPGSEDEEEG